MVLSYQTPYRCFLWVLESENFVGAWVCPIVRDMSHPIPWAAGHSQHLQRELWLAVGSLHWSGGACPVPCHHSQLSKPPLPPPVLEVARVPGLADEAWQGGGGKADPHLAQGQEI